MHELRGTTRFLTARPVARHPAPMTKQGEETWERRFCRRLKELREAVGWTQEQMAAAIGVEKENYKKYETRSPLPHRHVARLCLLVGISVDDLYDLAKPVRRLTLRRLAAADRARANFKGADA
jgi:DNA-binding XRE family transcriptional regulator